MSSYIPFQLHNFEAHCDSLKRVGINPGYVMYTNHHASDNKPAARQISANHLLDAIAYINDPSDDNFRRLVQSGVLFDTEWDHNTKHWQIIDFEGWEVLHKAFSHLQVKASKSLMEITGIPDVDFISPL